MESGVFCAIKRTILSLFTLLFIACPQPINLKTFQEDEKVKEIIEKINSGNHLTYEHPTEIGPQLGYSISGGGSGTLANNDELSVNISKILTITVTNADDYDSIEWTYDAGTALPGAIITNNEILTFTAGTDAPFTATGTYYITVVGEIDQAVYSTAFTLIIRP
jgi:hypothetical protein